MGSIILAIYSVLRNNVSIIYFVGVFSSPASLHLELGQFEEAEKIYRDLLRRNPENHSYYKGLEGALRAGTVSDDNYYSHQQAICRLLGPSPFHSSNLSQIEYYSVSLR